MSDKVQRFLQDCETFTNQVLVPKQSAIEWVFEGLLFAAMCIVMACIF